MGSAPARLERVGGPELDKKIQAYHHIPKLCRHAVSELMQTPEKEAFGACIDTRQQPCRLTEAVSEKRNL